MTLMDKACWERGCACFDARDGDEFVEVVEKKEWVGLTDDEIEKDAGNFTEYEGFAHGAYWAEAKLKERNHG